MVFWFVFWFGFWFGGQSRSVSLSFSWSVFSSGSWGRGFHWSGGF